MPVGGLLIGKLACSTCEIEILDEEGRVVPGALVTGNAALEERGLFAWKPEEPWISGTYRVRSTDERQGLEEVEFTAVSAAPTSPTWEAEVSRVVRVESSLQCRKPSDSILGSCGVPSVVDKIRFKAQLSLAPSGSAAGQYLYQVTWSSPGAELTEEIDEVSGLAHDFDGAPSEVCYSLRAEPVDQERQAVVVERTCLATDQLEDLDTVERTRNAVDDMLRSCVEPPSGFEEVWCALVIDEKECKGPADTCAAALAACDLSGGTGGSPGDDGGTGYGGENEVGADGEGTGDESGGCTFSGVSSSAGSGNWLLLLAGFGAGALRLGRSRPRPAQARTS